MAEHDREQQIRDRAYRLWEQEGRKDGDHERHWQQASSEIDADQNSQDGGSSQGQGSENNAQEGGGLGGGMDAASAQGIVSGIQPGGMTPGGGPAPGADAMGSRKKGAKGIPGPN